MTLQAKLTLGFVVLVVSIVGFISAADLTNDMQQQFEATLKRAELLTPVAFNYVKKALNSQLTVALDEALKDKTLAGELLDLLTQEHAILEIAVVDRNNQILGGSDPVRVGERAGPYPDFRDLVLHTDWLRKAKVLLSRDTEPYQIERTLGNAAGETVLSVRVIIAPVLIRDDITPALIKDRNLALASLIGALTITFLFSWIVFRPVGRLRRQLDLLVRGEYEPSDTSANPATDEFSMMASKVNLLGERLRGAQFEVSDLRGNMDRMFQDLEDAVLIFNKERRLVFASGAVDKFLGQARFELIGKMAADIFAPTTKLGLLIQQAAEAGQAIRGRRVSLEGAVKTEIAEVLLTVEIFGELTGARSGSAFLVRLRDPEAQRKIGRELQTADRLAAISRVSGGVAHEVKNPLNSILLHVELAKTKLAAGDTDVIPQMEIVSKEILRLDRVVRTFLDFSRPVELNLSTMPLTDFLGEIIDFARPQAEASGVRVEAQLSVDGAEVRVDRDLLRQAFLNVVMNALEAMPKGGELLFEAAPVGDGLEIRITDTGAGIPPELRDKIFRLYFTTRKEGSGIGLAMSFRIVQMHDGTIDFTSEPGKGTTFFIRLPAAA